MAGSSPKPPTFRVRFDSYDDFLVEYGDHLRKGFLVLPPETGLAAEQRVRIKLILPDETAIHLEGITRPPVDELQIKPNMDVHVQLAPYTAEQSAALERCVTGALAHEPGKVPDVDDPSSAINLLLVDDLVSVRIELGDALRERGLRVRVAENGLVAIAAALKRPPDVILSDVEMPVMDGWTFLRMTRARQRLAPIPFVFFTRLDDDLSRLQAYRMGVEDFLPKDTRPDEILARLQGVLSRHKSRRAADRPNPAGSTGGQGLRGDLVHVKLGSLLSFLEAERRTGHLVVENGHDRATLEVVNGMLKEVRNLGNYTHPHDRVFELLDWNAGEFEFFAGEEFAGGDAAKLTTVTYLLMEHARRADEAAEADGG